MSSIRSLGTHLLDVTAILLLGLAYVVALALGTAARAVRSPLSTLRSIGNRRGSSSGHVVDGRGN